MVTNIKNPTNNANQESTNQIKAPTILRELEIVLGAINWLTIHSPSHRHLFISDLEWAIIPPVMLNQFKIFRDNEDRAIGYTSWARISEDVENRILSTGNAKLAPGDWNSGDIVFLIDVLTPFGGNFDIVKKLYDSEFKDKKEVSIVRPKLEGKGLEKVALKDLIESVDKKKENKYYN